MSAPRPPFLVVNGNALALPFADESMHCCVTSPPYFGGLRDYGIPPLVWGGDPACRHTFLLEQMPTEAGRGNWAQAVNGRGEPQGDPAIYRQPLRSTATTGACTSCGAWYGQLGLEPTPELYLGHMVTVFREVRRVLRRDGTLWLNLGDVYSHGKARRQKSERWNTDQSVSRVAGLQDGNLVGIPWRLFLALQEDGWHARADQVWQKPNPMPESIKGWRWERHHIRVRAGEVPRQGDPRADGYVAHGDSLSDKRPRKVPSGWDTGPGDHRGGVGRYAAPAVAAALWAPCAGCHRCEVNGGYILRRGSWRPTRSHEYLFLLSRRPRYFGDPEPVREATTGGAHGRGVGLNPKSVTPGQGNKANTSFHAAVNAPVSARNLRSVWTIPTQSFQGAHFATFPVRLAHLCIAATTSDGGVCPRCGAPRARVVTRPAPLAPVTYGGKWSREGEQASGLRMSSNTRAARLTGANHDNPFPVPETTGWRQTCRCAGDLAPVPAVVLDPFSGAGSTGVAALRLGRRFVGAEVGLQYCTMQLDRMRHDKPRPPRRRRRTEPEQAPLIFPPAAAQ